MTDRLRGELVACNAPTTVETEHGERRLAELRVRPTDGTPTNGDSAVDVTLWSKWADTAEEAEAGMDLLLTNPEEGEEMFSRGLCDLSSDWCGCGPRR